MARQILDRGTVGNDGTGDDLYTGAGKINDNFEELYGDVVQIRTILGADSASELGIRLHDSSNNSSFLVYEGTADSHETSLGVVDPTADRVILLPDSDGTVALKQNVTDEVAALSATLDSDYVAERSREATPDFIDIKHYSVATVPPGVHGRMIFVTDGNAGNPCLAVFDSSGGFYRRIVLGAAVNT